MSLCFGPLGTLLRQKSAKLTKLYFTFYKGKSRPEKSRDPGIWQNPVPENPGIKNLDPARACSPDLHLLLKTFAESRVAALSRSQGWEAGPGKLGKVMGDIRRALSVTIVRANAMCLLERLSQLGPGAGAAAKRRQVAVRLEERRRQDRQAFDLAWQARGASMVGRAFIQ